MSQTPHTTIQKHYLVDRNRERKALASLLINNVEDGYITLQKQKAGVCEVNLYCHVSLQASL